MNIIGAVIDPLAPVLRPLTALIPGPIERLGIGMLGNEVCYDTLIRQVDFVSNPECVSLGISKGISWGIVAMSSVVKVPQIINLLSSQSPEGISLTSYILETIGYVVNTAYNYRAGFPFSTFGESALISVQNIIITMLILAYSGRRDLAAAFVAIASIGGAIIINPNSTIIDHFSLLTLQKLTIPLGLASKIPQVYTIWRTQSVGQLSGFAVASYLLGSLARVFTTFKEVDDKLILFSFLGAFVLNTVLAIQFVVYSGRQSSRDKDLAFKRA